MKCHKKNEYSNLCLKIFHYLFTLFNYLFEMSNAWALYSE